MAYTFSQAGTRVIRVIAVDEDGRTGGALRTVDVHADNLRPSVSLFLPASARTGQEIKGELGGDPDGLIDEVQLDLDGIGGFEVVAGNGKSLPVTFATAGVRKIRARVTDDAGASSISTATLDVHESNFEPFVALSTFPSTPRAGVPVALRAYATDVDGKLARYNSTSTATASSARPRRQLIHVDDVRGGRVHRAWASASPTTAAHSRRPGSRSP